MSKNKKQKNTKEISHNKPKLIATEIKGEFILPIPYHLYGQFVSWLLESRDAEIAGFFSIEDGMLSWAVRCSGDGVAAHVTMTHEQILEATKLRDEENKRRERVNESQNDEVYKPIVFSGQWHTHPGFTAFWSGTDQDDQDETVADMIDLHYESGETMFLVYNIGHFRLRKWHWFTQPGGKPEIFYQDGVVVLGEERLDYEKASYYTSSYKINRTSSPPNGWQDGAYNYGFDQPMNESNGQPAYDRQKVLQEIKEEETWADDDLETMVEWAVESFDEPDQVSFRQCMGFLDDRELDDIVLCLNRLDRHDVAAEAKEVHADLVENAFDNVQYKGDDYDDPDLPY